MLETEEHARARGAKIYAAVVGGGVTADSYHITAPEPEGLGASRAVRLALEAAGASVDDVTHINAHATSTPTGDIAEYKALLSVFGDRVHEIPVSATKASTGHLLGGTGALEAIFTILALRDRQAPPTINLTTQDPEIPLRISGSPIPLGDGPQLAISNSFGFGGHNAVVAFASRLTRTSHEDAPEPRPSGGVSHVRRRFAVSVSGIHLSPTTGNGASTA